MRGSNRRRRAIYFPAPDSRDPHREASGMIGWCTEVGLEYWPPGWRSERAPCGFKSDKHRVDLFKNPGVVELHRPAMLRLLVVVEDPETVRSFAVQFVAVTSPGGIHEFSVGGILRRQVER